MTETARVETATVDSQRPHADRGMEVSVRPRPAFGLSHGAVIQMTGPIRNLPDDLRKNLGRNCRWLDGAVRQQCVGHLPFARRATVNGGFSILPTGSTDP